MVVRDERIFSITWNGLRCIFPNPFDKMTQFYSRCAWTCPRRWCHRSQFSSCETTEACPFGTSSQSNLYNLLANDPVPRNLPLPSLIQACYHEISPYRLPLAAAARTKKWLEVTLGTSGRSRVLIGGMHIHILRFWLTNFFWNKVDFKRN